MKKSNLKPDPNVVIIPEFFNNAIINGPVLHEPGSHLGTIGSEISANLEST